MSELNAAQAAKLAGFDTWDGPYFREAQSLLGKKATELAGFSWHFPSVQSGAGQDWNGQNALVAVAGVKGGIVSCPAGSGYARSSNVLVNSSGSRWYFAFRFAYTSAPAPGLFAYFGIGESRATSFAVVQYEQAFSATKFFFDVENGLGGRTNAPSTISLDTNFHIGTGYYDGTDLKMRIDGEPWVSLGNTNLVANTDWYGLVFSDATNPASARMDFAVVVTDLQT